MTPTPTISLADAISAVEQNQNAFQATESKLAGDQSVREGIAKKLSDQDAVISDDQVSRKTAAQQFNAALRVAAGVFTAAIIPGVDDPAPPAPEPPPAT